MTTYGLLLFPDAEELDFVGPWEVFTASAMVREAETGERLDTVVTIAESDPVTCAKGLRVLADHDLTNHPELDLVLVPGGMGTRVQAENSAVNEWLAARAGSAQWMTSVCTGSLLLHTSGVASPGTPLATHWGFEDGLTQRGATVVRDARWVRHGNIVSSQGVSAGIDMALWLIGQLHNPAHARSVQRYIQYDPAPPYQADV